ncbi:MAG: archease [Desulfobacteraceae bacterium]|nr:archease [Desulfobacteraceae bacterium]
MPYEVIDHTADTGIRVRAESLHDLFTEAARAMFEMITDTKKLEIGKTREVHASGADRADLLVNWLRELLLIWNLEQYLVKSVDILEMSGTKLKARAFTQLFDPDRHPVYTDIKAVTYHCAQVAEKNGGWEATVIFDV